MIQLRSIGLWAAITAIIGALGVSTHSSSAVTHVTPRVTVLGPVLGVAETNNRVYDRDDGLSVALPNGQDLWVFGDTIVSTRVNRSSPWKERDISGSSAGTTAIRRLTRLDPLREFQTGGPLGGVFMPTRFVPQPQNAYMSDGSGRACLRVFGAAWQARWASGAVLLHGGRLVFVTYHTACVVPPSYFTVEGFGYMVIDIETRQIVAGPNDVYPPQIDGRSLPRDFTLGSPVLNGTKVSMYWAVTCPSGSPPTCTPQLQELTTGLSRASLMNQANYAPVPVSTVPGFNWSNGFMSVTRDRAHGFVAVNQSGITGLIMIATAPSATGPFAPLISATIPCRSVTFNHCRAFVYHPELSSTNSLVISYYNPGYEEPYGHELLARIDF